MGHWQSKPIEDSNIILGDMLLEISARLPVKSLMRFKAVCKSWNAAICDPSFVRLYLHLSMSQSKSKLPPLLIVAFTGQQQVNLHSYSEGEGITKLSSLSEAIPRESMLTSWCPPLQCDGLVVTVALQNISVCNPSTMELLALPKGSMDQELPPMFDTDPMVGFGFDSCAKKYKIVRCFCSIFDPAGLGYKQDLEVFTLGTTSNSWRLVAGQPQYPIARITPTCSRGAVYWTIRPRPFMLFEKPASWSATLKGFLRFDLSDESFSLFPGPPVSWLDGDFNFRLTDLDDEQLCFVHLDNNNGEVKMWSAKDGRNPTWASLCTISINLQQQPLPHYDLPIPCALSSDGMILVQIHEALFRCDPRTGALNQWFDIAAEEKLCNAIHSKFQYEGSRFIVVRCPKSLLPIRGQSLA